jgi:hypothetical protein
MSYKHLILSVLFSGILLSSSGCVRVDTVHVDKGGKHPTLGDQIAELVGAHESGMISDDEFRKLRGNLIRKFGR